MRKRFLAIWLCFVMILNAIPVFGGPDDYIHEESTKIYKNTKLEALTAKAAILMDVDSGRILFNKESEQKLPIASITKVMTILLTMEAIDSGKIKLDDLVPVSPDAEAMGGSEAYLKVGETFTVHEMLKAIVIHSSNDVCVAMAEFIAGSESVFVERMNQKAKALGMLNTNFLDCTGLTDEGHYSTAHDIAIMSRELLGKHPKVIEYATIWMDTFRDGKFRLDNTNKLVNPNYYKGITGLKTGFTSKAGYCVALSAKRENTHLVAVVLGTSNNNTRFAEGRKLLDHGFANYKRAELLKKGEDTGLVNIDKATLLQVKTVTKEPFAIMLNNDELNRLKKETVFVQSLTAPLAEGDKVGEMVLKIDDTVLGKVDLVTAEAVEPASFLRRLLRKIMALFGIAF